MYFFFNTGFFNFNENNEAKIEDSQRRNRFARFASYIGIFSPTREQLAFETKSFLVRKIRLKTTDVNVCKQLIVLFISDPLTEKLLARLLSWKSNADESDGWTTLLPRLPRARDGHQLVTGNLVNQKPSGACLQNKDKCGGIVAALCPTENEED